MSYGDLQSLFEQFFALVEATVRLPPSLERRAAFRDVRDYGARIHRLAYADVITARACDLDGIALKHFDGLSHATNLVGSVCENLAERARPRFVPV